MNISAVIFDFNGTLFWDTEFQESSWDEYFLQYNIQLSAYEKREYLHGRNGEDTFNYIFKKQHSKGEIEILTEDKENLYREECLKHTMELAPGAISLIETLLDTDIKIGIATASGKTNVDFFVEQFDLLRFFEKKHIIYNDGTIKGKPNPDLFFAAMDALDVTADELIIFEDSVSGIKAAENAGINNIVIVNSNNETYNNFNYPVITHFDQFDRSIFDSKSEKERTVEHEFKTNDDRKIF